MKSNDSFLKAFPITWILTIIVGVTLGFAIDASTGISFALGSVTTLMMMSMLYKAQEK